MAQVGSFEPTDRRPSSARIATKPSCSRSTTVSERRPQALLQQHIVAKLVRWWVAALILWLGGLAISEAAASGIAAHPQPDQIFWVMLFRLVPLMPPVITAGFAGFIGTQRGMLLEVGLRSAQVLLWGRPDSSGCTQARLSIPTDT